MNIDDCSLPLHPAALAGLALFNAGEYFEAHEALEDAWREEQGDVRLLYQGMLQIAVVYMHIQRSNYEGAVQLYERALPKLERWPDVCRGVDIASLRVDAARVMEAVNRLGPQRLMVFDQGLFRPIRYEKQA